MRGAYADPIGNPSQSLGNHVSAILQELVELLSLERIEHNIFRGTSQDLGWGQVFGGQVLGQALSAAEQTVDVSRTCHSLHGYFLRRGDAAAPIVYQVDRIRDGRSFTTRRVVATQHGKAIFNLSASFQVAEEGLEHADPMPDAPDPESLKSERELAQELRGKIPEPLFEQVVAGRPIEARQCSPIDPTQPVAKPAHRQVWFKAAGPLPEQPSLHQYLLAYASDFHFLATALQPHGRSWLQPDLQIASLDHAMWFHQPINFNDWILYDVRSPQTGSSRGLVHGRFYSRDGKMLASTSQEGLMRVWKKPPPKG